jgi:hypothetical protein
VITVSCFSESERADVVEAFRIYGMTDYRVYVQGKLTDEQPRSA